MTRSAARPLAALALVVFLAANVSIARADKTSFINKYNDYYQASNGLHVRLTTLSSFENGATEVDIWTKDALAKVKAYDASAQAMSSTISLEVGLSAGNDHCQNTKELYYGPYGIFGFEQLGDGYALLAGQLQDAMKRLSADQDKVAAKIGDALLAGRPPDKTQQNLLTSLRHAIAALTPSLQLMQAERDHYAGIRNNYSNVLNDCNRKPTPTPSPRATPSPSPKPSGFLRSKSGCVGFNGWWGTQRGSIIINGTVGKLETATYVTHTTTFNGNINGNVMAGNWTDPSLGKGTFTFTLHADGDSIDVTLINTSGAKASYTSPCERGL